MNQPSVAIGGLGVTGLGNLLGRRFVSDGERAESCGTDGSRFSSFLPVWEKP